jgi:hypothetical protein
MHWGATMNDAQGDTCLPRKTFDGVYQKISKLSRLVYCHSGQDVK